MPPSRKQCSSTKSRTTPGRILRAPVQNVTNKSASAFCKCGSRLRYRYFSSDDALVDMCGMCGADLPSPARLGLHTHTLLGVMSVTNEHARQVCCKMEREGRKGS